MLKPLNFIYIRNQPFSSIYGMSMDEAHHTLYIADIYNYRIKLLDSNTYTWGRFDNGQSFGELHSVAFNKKNGLVVVGMNPNLFSC